jgi:hypothetical protein
LAVVKGEFGDNAVKEATWPGLPPFHGILYGDYLSYYPWAVDIQGKLSGLSSWRFMRRDHDPDMFERLRDELVRGFCSEKGTPYI